MTETVTLPAGLLHILQHSLGVDRYGRGEQYRNHFVTGEGSIDHPLCIEAVHLGLMVRCETNALTGGMDLFMVTKAGRQTVRDHSPPAPKVSRAAARYQRFLDVSDVMDITFGEFLRREREFAR